MTHRVPTLDEHGNGAAGHVATAERFAAEDEERAVWLKAHIEKTRWNGQGGPCRGCGRPLSVRNTSGLCSVCRGKQRPAKHARPNRRGMAWHKRRVG